MGVELTAQRRGLRSTSLPFLTSVEGGVGGQVFSVFIIVLAAAEAAIALAIVLAIFRHFKTINSDITATLRRLRDVARCKRDPNISFAAFQRAASALRSLLCVIALFPLLGAAINGLLGQANSGQASVKRPCTPSLSVRCCLALPVYCRRFLQAVNGLAGRRARPTAEQVVPDDSKSGDFRVDFSLRTWIRCQRCDDA